jgi:threonine 3-dehydrogenase
VRTVVAPPTRRSWTIDLPNHVIFKGATVLGINGRLMFDTWYRAEELLTSGRVNVGQVVSHEVPLEEAERAFALLGDGSAMKVLLRVA